MDNNNYNSNNCGILGKLFCGENNCIFIIAIIFILLLCCGGNSNNC